MKITDFGAFAELEPGLTTLLHSSELSWTKKNASAKKMFKLHQQIPVWHRLHRERAITPSELTPGWQAVGANSTNEIFYYHSRVTNDISHVWQYSF